MTPHFEHSRDSDQAALRFAAAGNAALCTIVGIDGSFSRRVGAQLAVGAGGQIVGSLVDGCLERELARQSALARTDGRPLVLRYGKGSPVIDFRLPCGSGLDILIDPAPRVADLREAVRALDARQEASVALSVPGAALHAVRRYIPEPRLLVLGDGAEARALADLGSAFGARCELVEPGEHLSLGHAPAGLAADRWTAIVLLFHDHEWDVPLLGWALSTPAFYVGAIGGRTAREARVAGLGALGHAAGAVERVRSPAGLIPNARDAGTLALGILAEIVREYETLRP